MIFTEEQLNDITSQCVEAAADVLHAGGPGSGRRPYGKKDHDEFKKQVASWKKELKTRRDLSPNSKHQELQNRVFSWDKGQKEIDHLRDITSGIKDATTKEFLNRVHETLTDKDGNFDHFSDRGLAHAYLKKAERESPGVTDKLEPSLVTWIKFAPSSKDDDDIGDDDLSAAGTGTYPPDHKFGMEVPKGGSNCEKCRYVSLDKEHCGNDHFIKWNGSGDLPMAADVYCCDVFEAAKNMQAGGPGSGRHKEYYHGTTSKFADSIRQNGLKQRRGTSTITTDRAYAERAARLAVEEHGGKPVVVVLKESASKYFDPDVVADLVDSKSNAHVHPDNISSIDELKAATENAQAGQFKGTIWNGIKVTGFTGPEEEGLRALLSRVPPELLFNVKEIVSAPELNAKHGQFLPETKQVKFNPSNFQLRQRYGKGPAWMLHQELTAVHEIGHSIYDSLTPERVKQWEDLSGWIKGIKVGQAPPYVEKRPGWPKETSKWTHRPGVYFPRYYSERNANEHFSDCFAFVILGKGHQMSLECKKFIDDLIKDTVKKYPSALIASPSSPYPEKDAIRKAKSV